MTLASRPTTLQKRRYVRLPWILSIERSINPGLWVSPGASTTEPGHAKSQVVLP